MAQISSQYNTISSSLYFKASHFIDSINTLKGYFQAWLTKQFAIPESNLGVVVGGSFANSVAYEHFERISVRFFTIFSQTSYVVICFFYIV